MVKSYEMVYVSMGYKYIRDLQEFRSRHGIVASHIKKYCPLFSEYLDIKARVIEGTVYEIGVKTGFHNNGPNGIRTRVSDVRGQRPRPLDDGAIINF